MIASFLRVMRTLPTLLGRRRAPSADEIIDRVADGTERTYVIRMFEILSPPELLFNMIDPNPFRATWDELSLLNKLIEASEKSYDEMSRLKPPKRFQHTHALYLSGLRDVVEWANVMAKVVYHQLIGPSVPEDQLLEMVEHASRVSSRASDAFEAAADVLRKQPEWQP